MATELDLGVVTTTQPGSNGIGVTLEVEEPDAEPKERRSSRLWENLKGAVERKPSEQPKRRGRPKKSNDVLSAESVSAWILTLHNIPAAVLELEALRLDPETVEPYAPDLARYLNEHMPDLAGQAQANVALLGVLGYIGLVEAPTLVNTYKEILRKQRERREGNTLHEVPPPPRAATPGAPASIYREPSRVVPATNGRPADQDMAVWGERSQIDAINRLPH